MHEKRQIRDPIFGFIPITEKEGDVINSPIFQRLRGIRQLAFANLVYPGALHTRFEHSLGVCHISSMMARRLGIENEGEDLIRLGALLHDIGHGPFSHVSEEALEIYTDRSILGDIGKREKIHEILTADIINQDTELIKIIGTKDCEKITKILNGGYGKQIYSSLISGPLDADKQDYLLRDSHFCGVKYGMFDIDQLHSELRAVEDGESNEKTLAITTDGIHALEQFMLAKYYLTTQVYRHKIRLITDQMLIRAVVLGIDNDEIEELRKLYSYDKSDEFITRYTDFNDANFLIRFTDDKFKGKHCCDVLKRLQQRKLLKRVYEKRISELPEECRIPISNISQPEYKEKRKELEKNIFDVIKKILKDNGCGELEPHDVDPSRLVVNSYKIKSVREQSRDDEGRILIDKKPPIPFEEGSDLFKSIDESLKELFVEVYAPVLYNPIQKRQLLQIAEEKISEIIASFNIEGDGNANS